VDCREVKALVDRWEKGIDLRPAEKESLSIHLLGCEFCQKRYKTLLPFLLEGEGIRTAFSKPVPDIATLVLGRIRRLEEEKTQKAGWRRFFPSFTESFSFSSAPLSIGLRRLAPVAALGLVLLIGGGVFFRLVPGVFVRSPSDEVTVRFTLEHVNARSVSLVGDFSDWKSYPLERVGDRWEIKIKLKKGRVYTYNFVVDGEHWVPDPKVPFRVEDGFGGEATLLQL